MLYQGNAFVIIRYWLRVGRKRGNIGWETFTGKTVKVDKVGKQGVYTRFLHKVFTQGFYTRFVLKVCTQYVLF